MLSTLTMISLLKLRLSPLRMTSNLPVFDRGFKAVLSTLLAACDKPDFSANALIPSLKPLPF